jgi:hypothetical protein
MHPSVRVRLPDGTLEILQAGEIIGRTWASALRLDQPEISEAHAMVSLRGERLWLLALRRRFHVDGRPSDGVALERGQTITLAPGVDLKVEHVALPDVVLGLQGPGLAAQVLAGTCSLVRDPHPRLVPGTPAGALAQFWPTESRWRARTPGDPARPLLAGDVLHLPCGAYTVVEIGIGAAGQTPTRVDPDAPLRIVTHFDTVHLHRADSEVVVLTGQLARVVSELAAIRQPVAWEELARPHWPHIADREILRRRWDGLLGRLRDRLRDGGIRPDLVSSTRIGLVEFVLRAGDDVEDRS